MTKEKLYDDEAEPSPEEKFAGAYEGAIIVPVSYDDLPPVVAERFEGKSKMYILPEAYIPKNFSHLYLMTHPDGMVTYVALQTKAYSGTEEELVYVLDMVDGEPAGHGEVRHRISSEKKLDYLVGLPFVGMTATYGSLDERGGGKNFARSGLGARRLVEMNACSIAEFGKTLSSAENPSPEAKRIWERFVEEGKAEIYVAHTDKEGNEYTRYRMKP